MLLNIDRLTFGPMCRTKGIALHVRVSLSCAFCTRIACWRIGLVGRLINTLRDRDLVLRAVSVIGERKSCF